MSGRRPGRIGRAVPLVAAGYLAGVVLLAVLAPAVAPHDPYDQQLADALLPPGMPGQAGLHLLGTDELGRDTFSRLVYGARPILLVAAASVALAATIGSAVGLISGFARRALDHLFMRLSDIQLSLPPLVLAILLAVAVSPGVGSAVAAISLVIWPQYARVVRAETLRVSTSDYVLLARVAGLGRVRTLVHHVVPNTLNIVVVLATLNLAIAVIFSAGLSFLGAGVQAPRPDWGNMLAGGTQYLQSWWLTTFPGLAITATVLALNIVGDHVRDVLDPRLSTGLRDAPMAEGGAH